MSTRDTNHPELELGGPRRFTGASAVPGRGRPVRSRPV
jgi:hypothetical protein